MKLANHQMRAIRRSKELGRVLRERFPEMADDYRGGSTQREIVMDYKITQRYYVPIKVAIGAVSLAIRGHDGGLGVDPYSGLINDESELEALCNQHRNRPLRMHSHEELSEYGKKGGYKGGVIGGATNKRNKTGICGMTKDDARKAGLKSAQARGHFLWDNPNNEVSEIELAYRLSHNKKYRIGNKISHVAITRELNNNYHHDRTPKTVKAALQRYAGSQIQ